MTTTTPPLTGRPATRLEDGRLTTGRGRFVADLPSAGALHAVVVRSRTGHGRVTELDVDAVRTAPGVVAVYTAADLDGRVDPFPAIFHKVPPALLRQIDLEISGVVAPLMAGSEIHRFGQPLALVVAETAAAAQDAADLVQVRVEDLPPVLDVVAAAQPDSPVVFPEMGSNVHTRFRVSKGDAGATLGTAASVLRHRFRIGRQVGSPLETRSVLADWDEHAQRLTVWDTTQHQHLLRNTIAALLHLAQDQVRVVVPDMGGSFGGGMYPEDVLVPFAAHDLRRAVRWTEQRWENLAGTRHSRDQVHDVEVAYDATGRILALRDEVLLDSGTHNFFGPIMGYNTASHLLGQYDIEHYDVGVQVVVTHKTPNSPVRGAGRFEAAFVMDRVVDMVATELGMDPADVRRRNLVPAEAMPYAVGFPYRDGNPYVYDSGNFPDQLEQALQRVDYPALRVELAELRAQGRHVGVGIGTYTEASGYGPFEPALVRVEPSGHVVVHAAAAPHGQSHETMITNLCADALTVPPERVRVRTGDSDLLPFGVGTFASRGAVTTGSAVHLAAGAVKEKALAAAAEILGLDVDRLELVDGAVRDRDDPTTTLSLGAVALALLPATPLAAKLGPGLEASQMFVPPAVTVASGTHVAVVEVDPVTGTVQILRYLVAHDCGRPLNPTVVDGQARGGVAHGLGCTFAEEIRYDARGVPTPLDLGSYGLVTAPEVPDIELVDLDWPTPLNPLGVKGVGEGGAVGVAPAVCNAVVDAMRPLRLVIDEVPLTPARLRRAIREAQPHRSGTVPVREVVP